MSNERYSTGSWNDLQEVIRVGQAAVDATPENHSDRALRLDNLGVMLRDRYSRTESLNDLQEAIRIGKAAVDVTSEDHPDRARYLNNLGAMMRDRYSRTGTMTDLEIAIQLFQEALDTTPADHPDRAGRLHNLGIGYHDRFERTGAMTDLEIAIQRHQEALDTTPANHPDRAGRLHKLGIGYRDRYKRIKAMTDTDIAIQPFQKALDTTSTDNPALSKPSSRFVDSGYGTASNGQSIHHKSIEPVELVSEEQNANDIRTEYSELSETSSIMRTYLNDLADELFSVIYIPQTDPKHMHRLCGILTGLLQQFAFRTGLKVPSKKGREVMFYVYRNRRCVQKYNPLNQITVFIFYIQFFSL